MSDGNEIDGVRADLSDIPASADHFSHAPRVYRDDFEVMQGISDLMKAAEAGDERALVALHKQATSITSFLNEKHVGFAGTVTEWPVILRRSKRERTEDVDRALRLRIGGSAAKSKGQPPKFDAGSHRDFAYVLLDRVEFIRKGAFSLGACAEAISEVDLRILRKASEVEVLAPCLLADVMRLPDFGPESRMQWAGVMTDLAEANPFLIPEVIARTLRKQRIEPKTGRVVDDGPRGPSIMKQKIMAVLKGLERIPD